MHTQQIKDIKLNFILTTARTGSTLLSSMLNMHTNVISTIEEPFAYTLFPKYKRVKTWTSKTIQEYCYDFYLFSQAKLEMQFGTKKDLQTILEKHKANLTAEIAIKLTYLCFFPDKDKSNITAIVDKELLFHSCLEDVASFYPTSKFIILHRDPRDNAYAKSRMFENKKQYKSLGYFKIALAWKYIYGLLLKLKDKIGAERFLEVKYEDLVTNPEPELKKICVFVGIEYNDRMLTYDEQMKNKISQNMNENSTAVNNLALLHVGLTQKPKTNKIGYWKQNLKPDEANMVWTVCGNLAERIGYKKDENFVKQSITFKDRLNYIKFLFNRVKLTFYYRAPFFIKKLVKKVKYGKNFKTNRWTSKEFYERTYYMD
jgi:hypothetical protein